MAKGTDFGFDELIELIQEISSGVQVKEGLLVPEVKAAFKSMVREAGAAAAFMEVLNNQADPRHSENEDVVNGALDVIKATRAIDKAVFEDLCLNSGFTKRQVGAIGRSIERSYDNDTTASQILMESQSLGILLLQNPKIRTILAQDKIEPEGNDYDEFIRYVVGQGYSHVQLEKIARLTVYQRQRFEDDLKENEWLRKSFEKFKEEGKPTTRELERCSSHMRRQCVASMREHPIYFSAMNGIPCAKMSNGFEIDENYFEKKSPAGWPDAWGVDGGHAEIHCVTTLDNFLSQRSQSLSHAYAVSNGIKAGTLDGVSSFEVHGWCGSVVADDRHEHFNEILTSLVSKGAVSREDADAFKASPIHVEALKMLRFEAPEKFNELAKGHHLGLHSDKDFHFQLKNAAVQYELSFKSLQRAIGVLKKIAETNPSLKSIETAFAGAYETLAFGFDCAVNGLHGKARKHAAAVAKCQDGLMAAWESLEMASNDAKKASPASRNAEKILERQYAKFSETHKDQQNALASGDKSLPG
jgi:hypothetical protein